MTNLSSPPTAPAPATRLVAAPDSAVVPSPTLRRPSLLQRQFRQALHGRLRGLRSGALRLIDADGVAVFGEVRGPLGTITVTVIDPAFWTAIALQGDLGAGESYVAGHWHADDPVALVRLLVRDRHVLEDVDGGITSVLGRLGARVLHLLRTNTRRGARANIAAHYDLGDDFFALFLDPSMTYSAAVFASADATLAEAQQEKLRRLCRLVDLRPGDDVVEIGSGWGSMAACAAGEFGARVTTTTISARQFAAANARIAAAGLGDRVKLLQQDYRDLRGSFDKLLSCEMIEAVGARFLPAFLTTCSRLLRPGGAMALQAITLCDQHYAAALCRVDFIQKHVFPGSFIPSVTAIATAATAHTDLRLAALHDYGLHYARTLREWRRRLLEQASAARALGYPPELLRTFDWYLAYCEGGFAERHISVCQMRFEKPGCGAALGPFSG